LIRRAARVLGLLLSAAVLTAVGEAQDTTAIRRDTTVVIPIPPRADSMIVADSAALPPDTVRVVPDSIQPPIARSEFPRLADAARPRLRWDRDSLFGTGALNLLDLLERIPGVTGFRTSWITSPMVASYLGQPGRVRIFLDGLELDPLDPRAGGIEDLSAIPIWAAEEVAIERGASEIRVYIQTWRVERTTPESRVDVGTGDQETNLYRGFLGRRFTRGEVIQFAGQQVTSNPRFGGTASASSFFGRIGWAGRQWSVDAAAVRVSPHRGELTSPESDFSLSRFQARRTDAYVRVGYGDPSVGVWLRGMAAASDLGFVGVAATTPPADDIEVPTADSSRSRTQYVLSGGWSRGPLRVSATQRVRAGGGSTVQTPAVRASLDLPLVTVSGFAEGKGIATPARAEAMARFSPLSFLSIGGAFGQEGNAPAGAPVATGSASSTRIEGAVRIGELWLGGGMLRRGATVLGAPRVVVEDAIPVQEGATTGLFVTVHGRIIGPLFVDGFAIQWEDSLGMYRPRHESRSRLYVQSNFLRRFPSGNFGLHAGLTHEYRSHSLFPFADGIRRAGGYRLVGGLLEIRIQEAVATYQFRNLLFERYAQVPGFILPQQTQFYGVRWPFWN
jgi:hypothetical protein